MSKISSKRTILTSFLVDLGDIALNVTVMIITGSVVLLAEALEGSSDLVASGLLWIGLHMSKKRPDKKHPFGYGKALFSWTLLSAVRSEERRVGKECRSRWYTNHEKKK